MLGYFFGYLLTEKTTQHDQKCPPELRFSAGVQHESCSKKWKKIVGVGPRVRRCQTKNSGGVMLGYFFGYLLTPDSCCCHHYSNHQKHHYHCNGKSLSCFFTPTVFIGIIITCNMTIFTNFVCVHILICIILFFRGWGMGAGRAAGSWKEVVVEVRCVKKIENFGIGSP